MSNQVQTLLTAEKEASNVVAKAKQYRIQRLKDARAEAQKEIEALKLQKNSEFMQYEKKFEGDSGAGVKKAEEDTVKALDLIGEQYRNGKESVIAKLLATVADCKPEIHANSKPATLST